MNFAILIFELVIYPLKLNFLQIFELVF